MTGNWSQGEKGVRIGLFGWEKQQRKGWPTLLRCLHKPNLFGDGVGE